MRKSLYAGPAGTKPAGLLVSELVDRMVTTFGSHAATTGTKVVNQVESNLVTVADEELVAPILAEILSVVLSNARNGRVHIHAGKFRDTMMLEVEEKNNYNGYALAYSIHNLEPLARMIGGYISIRGENKLHTTITFSFPDSAASVAYDC